MGLDLRIKHAKDLVESALKTAKQHGASQAACEIDGSEGFSVAVRNGDVETLEHQRDSAFGITVYKGQQRGHASCGDLRESAITEAVAAACTLAEIAAPDPCAGLPDPKTLALNYQPVETYFPWDITPQQAIEDLKTCEAHTREHNNTLKTDTVSLDTSKGFSVLANSYGFTGVSQSTHHSLYCGLIATDNGEMVREGDYTSSRDPSTLLSVDALADVAAKRCLSRVGARSIKTQTVPVLFEAPVARGLIRHLISAISGGALYQQASFLCDSVGQSLFPDFVRLYEQPFLRAGIGSSPFDAEGVIPSTQDIVTDGILQRYVLGTYSGRRLQLPSTGNSGGVHNLTLTPGEQTFAQLIKQMDKGLIVTELMGQGIDIITGDYSRGAGGFWVENGEIQYPVHEITIAATLQDMFKNIVALGNDMDIRANIRCGSILLDQMTVAGQS